MEMDRRGDKDMIARPTGHGAMAVTLRDVSESLGSFMGWIKDNWFPLMLTMEIIGAVIAVKMGYYRKGVCFLIAALATIWIGGMSQ